MVQTRSYYTPHNSAFVTLKTLTPGVGPLSDIAANEFHVTAVIPHPEFM